MNRSRPIGALGQGGWEAGQAGLLPEASVNEGTAKSNKKDKLLADMYEMFLDSMEPEIIESVVQICGYKYKKSMDALLEMCGGKDSMDKTRVQAGARNLSQQSRASSSSSQTSGKSESDSFGMRRNNASSSMTPHASIGAHFANKDKMKQTMDFMGRSKMVKVRGYIENKYRIMILMRGCPGSGKSYLAEEIVLAYGGKPKDYIFSTDDYFMRNNCYSFQPTLLNEAHHWNQTRVIGCVRDGRSPIIIDNTNTQLWEMTVYASMAINYGYSIEILEPDTPWFSKLEELTKRNRHNVPREKIRGMLERYERGITVEGLIKSTGAKYSKSPPQVAEHALIPQGSRTENQERATNHRQSSGRREYILDQNSVPFFSFMKPTESPNLTSPDTTCLLTGGDGFYFGSNLSNQSAGSSKDVGGQGPINVLNSLPKSEESGLKKLHGGFKTSIVSLRTTGLDISDGGFDAANNTSASDGSASQTNLQLNFPLFSNLKSDKIELHDPSILSAVESKNTATILETEQNNHGSPSNVLIQNSEDISIDNLINSVQSQSIQAFESKESEDEKPDHNSSDVFIFNSELKSNENSLGSLSCPLLNINLNETNYNQTSSPIDWVGTAEWNVPEDTKAADPVQLKSTDSSVNWMGTADWDVINKSSAETTEQISLLKPTRSITSKNIDDYCQSVKDVNAGATSDVGGWLFSDNGSASWKPIDKIQEETFKKEKSLSPQGTSSNLQSFKFKKYDVRDKATNTHYADFFTSSNIASNVLKEGVTVLDAHDRDINEGRIVSGPKFSLKLMLDKGTLTENDFEVELNKETKQEKIKELARLFPNRPPASLKELLKRGNWDVNYVSNLLLDDTDSDIFSTSFPVDGSIDTDSDEESPTQQTAEENQEVAEAPCTKSAPACDGNPSGATAQEEAEEIKRHIEQSIDFSERSYSPHLLAIKNSRRGLREGAIPKSSFSVSEDSPMISAIEAVNEFKETTPESYRVASESSDDGDECNETLEFIIGQDFIQQLADKFGGSCNAGTVSPLVKFPVDLARQIYDIIFTSNVSEEEEDNEDLAMKLQCEEDERIAHQLYEEMLNNAGQRVESTPPQLREIMDMELAQAIYKADVDSLTQGSQELMANILAKRLLEDNYKQLDKRTLHDIFASCNNSFEDTVKTLQEALSTDDEVFSENGQAQREQDLIRRAKEASVQAEFKSVEDSIVSENPWDWSDPKASYNKYREKADQYLKERNEMYSKASDAFTRKQRSVAAYYARLGELNGKKYQHASAMAAAALAAGHTNSHSSDTLDLHHYKVVEAVIVFDLFVDYQIRRLSEQGTQHECLSIITGRGSHSVNGRPKIKPAILNRARKRNLRCQAVPQNPGVVRVWVAADSLSSHEIPG